MITQDPASRSKKPLASRFVRWGHRTSFVSPSARGLWPLIVPALVVTALLIVVPIVWSLVLSFTSTSGAHSFTLENFERMFSDSLFWQSVGITLFLFAACLVVQTILGVGLGYLLSIDVPGRRILQSVILIPSITASVAVGLLWLLIYDPTLGVANKLLQAVGLGDVVWLGNPQIAPWALVITDTWQWTPFIALIVSAGIRSLPSDIFEAASIDGAAGWKKGLHIGLPLLAPVLTVALMLRTVDLLRFFDLPFIMTDGGPVNATNTLNLYGYREAFVSTDPRYAATLQITLFVIVIVVAILFTVTRRRFTVEV